MIDSIQFIRAQLGRMSDAQIMRNLGLRRESDYRELRAQAMIDPAIAKAEVMPRRNDRFSVSRIKRPGPKPPQAVALLLATTHTYPQQLLHPGNDHEFATRDLCAWLLKNYCRQSQAAIGRLLDITEYSAGLSFRRYDNAMACGVESEQHKRWREQIVAQLQATP